jgi:hypothetical protein
VPAIQKFKKYTKILLYNLLVVWLVMELVLRTGPFAYLQTYLERVQHKYFSPFRLDTDNEYHISTIKGCKSLPVPEFNNPYCYNNEGLRDIDHTLQKPAKTKRYLAFGDSFTEGVGAPVDSAWWKLLQNKLNAQNGDTIYHEVFGCGSMGSDVCYCYHLLQDRLYKYKPDVVFYFLNFSDVFDLAVRGGMERFKGEGQISYRKKSPWWERFYQYSYVVRLFVHKGLGYDYFFRSPEEYVKDEQYGKQQICTVLDSMNRYCQARHIKFVVIFQPLSNEIAIRSAPFEPVEAYCTKRGVSTINLYKVFNTLPDDSAAVLINKYYWPVDGHCKPAGYNFFAGEIYQHSKEW